MNAILPILFVIIILRNIALWYGSLISSNRYLKPTATSSEYWYEVGLMWWIYHIAMLAITTFFLFCGMFILPSVMGVW